MAGDKIFRLVTQIQYRLINGCNQTGPRLLTLLELGVQVIIEGFRLPSKGLCVTICSNLHVLNPPPFFFSLAGL